MNCGRCTQWGVPEEKRTFATIEEAEDHLLEKHAFSAFITAYRKVADAYVHGPCDPREFRKTVVLEALKPRVY